MSVSKSISLYPSAFYIAKYSPGGRIVGQTKADLKGNVEKAVVVDSLMSPTVFEDEMKWNTDRS